MKQQKLAVPVCMQQGCATGGSVGQLGVGTGQAVATGSSWFQTLRFPTYSDRTPAEVLRITTLLTDTITSSLRATESDINYNKARAGSLRNNIVCASSATLAVGG